MKKIIALVLALSLVFAFAACKKTEKEPEATDATEIVTNAEGEEVVVPAEDETEAEAETNEDGETVEAATEEDAEEATKADGKPAEDNKKPDANKPAQKGLNSTNPAEVAAFYVKARNASLAKPPKGHQTMKLAGKLNADGGVGFVLKLANPIINMALKNNSVETNFVPAGGYADLKGSDITSCSAKVQGNYTIVNIKLKNQVDGSNGNKTNGGAVARGIGTLGSIDEALNELDGIELSKGRENVKLTYTDAYFTAKIDNNTGKIVGGTYHYLVKVNISSASISVKGHDFDLTNLSGAVDYTVKIGTDDK